MSEIPKNDKKYIELAKKLKALSDRGIGGEKIVAKLKLERLMADRGITIEDIEGVVKKTYWFSIKLQDQNLFWQIVASVLGDYEGFESRSKRTRKGVNCTAAEAIEIDHKYNFFLSAYQRELRIFYRAFVQANEIFRKRSVDEKSTSHELTDEDRAVLKMANGIEKNTFYKRLTATNS